MASDALPRRHSANDGFARRWPATASARRSPATASARRSPATASAQALASDGFRAGARQRRLPAGAWPATSSARRSPATASAQALASDGFRAGAGQRQLPPGARQRQLPRRRSPATASARRSPATASSRRSPATASSRPWPATASAQALASDRLPRRARQRRHEGRRAVTIAGYRWNAEAHRAACARAGGPFFVTSHREPVGRRVPGQPAGPRRSLRDGPARDRRSPAALPRSLPDLSDAPRRQHLL